MANETEKKPEVIILNQETNLVEAQSQETETVFIIEPEKLANYADAFLRAKKELDLKKATISVPVVQLAKYRSFDESFINKEVFCYFIGSQMLNIPPYGAPKDLPKEQYVDVFHVIFYDLEIKDFVVGCQTTLVSKMDALWRQTNFSKGAILSITYLGKKQSKGGKFYDDFKISVLTQVAEQEFQKQLQQINQ